MEGAGAALGAPTCRCSRSAFVFSFLAAWVCVRWLLRYVATHTFVPFAWYRIAFGIVVLATAWFGWVDWHA